MLKQPLIAILSGVFAAAIAVPVAAQQSPAVALSSTVMVERKVTDASGASRIEQVPADRVVPGDRLWFRTSYRNDAGHDVRDFVITNPLHPAVQLAPQADPELTVSVDKGRTWGKLADLHITAPDGSKRPAGPADVTHIRWTLGVIAQGEAGERAFAAVVN